MEKLINRVKQIISQPKEVWGQIKPEKTDVKILFTSYVLILALIPAIASFIGYGFIGINAGIFGRVASVEWGLNQAITSYFGTVIGILVSAWVISVLASKYNTSINMDEAAKLVGYSYTPALVAGIFYIIPSLSILALVGSIYSLYVLYQGFQTMTGVSEDKKNTYFVISLLVTIGVFILISIVLGIILASLGLATGSGYSFN